ncbi:MAG: hypothetical protein U0Z26_20020 [Anaerolineales bacterium]
MIWLVLVVFLQACAAEDILFPPTNTPAPTPTATITLPPPTDTITPSPTRLPTIVHISTQDPNQPTATFAPIPIFIEGGATVTPAPAAVTPTLSRPGPGFLSVDFTPNKIFWGSCKVNKSVVTAKVDDPEEVFSIVIFVRVKAAFKDDSTPWTTGDVMHDTGNGIYTYTLVGSKIEGHNHYKNSWVMVELVATNVKGEEVGRTKIYDQAIALSPCQ